MARTKIMKGWTTDGWPISAMANEFRPRIENEILHYILRKDINRVAAGLADLIHMGAPIRTMEDISLSRLGRLMNDLPNSSDAFRLTAKAFEMASSKSSQNVSKSKGNGHRKGNMSQLLRTAQALS